MSTLRVSNIEAKADVSSPSVNEKVKVTNSNGELLIHIDGATSGITTVGISTSGESFRFDSNQNVTFFGDITGTGLDVNGNADVSGNLNVGGVLTYEDVTNIDSVGLITARSGIKVLTGTATTALVVEGNARVTGILTVGTSSLTLDGTNNVVNVGTALTLGHTQGLQFHTQNLHSQGFEINNINATGIVTAKSGIHVTSGSIGIGTDNPLNGLDILQSDGRTRVTAFGHIITQNHNNSTTNYWSFAPRNGGELDIGYGAADGNGTVAADKVTITTGGNVGIKETSPDTKLHITHSNATEDVIKLEANPVTAATGERSRIIFNVTQSNGQSAKLGHIASHTLNNWGGELSFSTKPANGSPNDTVTERLRIDSSGRLRVGSQSGSDRTNHRLQVSSDGSDSLLSLQNFSNSDGSEMDIAFYALNTNNASVKFAQIVARADETQANSSQQGSLKFSVNLAASMTDVAKFNTNGHFVPATDNTFDLGGSSERWRNIYTADLQMSNEGSANDVDGTWGKYTIQEGENDLFLINRRSGKRYKFNLTEVN